MNRIRYAVHNAGGGEKCLWFLQIWQVHVIFTFQNAIISSPTNFVWKDYDINFYGHKYFEKWTYTTRFGWYKLFLQIKCISTKWWSQCFITGLRIAPLQHCPSQSGQAIYSLRNMGTYRPCSIAVRLLPQQQNFLTISKKGTNCAIIKSSGLMWGRNLWYVMPQASGIRTTCKVDNVLLMPLAEACIKFANSSNQ